MKISVLGWYNHGNLGDEAMLEGIQYLCDKHFGPCDFTVMSDAHVDVPAVNASDLFILGGGELINQDRLFVNLVAWDSMINTRKAIVGCGLNSPDYASLEDHVKRSLRRFSFIGARDYASYRFLQDDPQLKDRVHLSLDPALILASKHGIAWKPMEGVVAIVPTDRRYNRYDLGIVGTDIIENTKQQLLNHIKRENAHLALLLAFGGDDNDDYASCMQLAEHLKPHISTRIVKPQTPREALELLSACSKVYAYRLHGFILAHSLGIPVINIRYHRKVKRNVETLMQLNNEETLRVIEKAWSQLAAN